LDDNETFQKLPETEPEKCDEIKRGVIGNADGVFCWVIMLLNQLEDALINEDSVAKLEEIVRSTPIELDAFFLHILDTIIHRYRQKYVIFDRIISEAPRYIIAIQCSFLLETIVCYTPREITKKIPLPVQMDDDTFNARIRLVKTQVVSRSPGISRGDELGPVFKFTHRSIPELLQRKFSSNLATYNLDDQLVGELLAWTILATFRFRLYLSVDEPRQSLRLLRIQASD
jgi:hypothetical protein